MLQLLSIWATHPTHPTTRPLSDPTFTFHAYLSLFVLKELALSMPQCKQSGQKNFDANLYIVSLHIPNRKSDTAHNGTAVSPQAST